MKVIMVLEFPGVDANSEEADEIVDFCTEETVQYTAKFSAQKCVAYVEDAQGDAK